MAWYEWIAFVALWIVGLWLMAYLIERYVFRPRGRKMDGSLDYSEMDPPKPKD